MLDRNDSSEELHLLVLPGAGREGSNHWRTPGYDTSLEAQLDAIEQTVLAAERATFDGVLIADFISRGSSPEAWRTQGAENVDPITTASYLAAKTSHIGIAATLSTTFEEPYHVARRVLSLDHLSRGRAGWNVVTSISPDAAHSFGLTDLPSHSARYERATEFVDTVRSLWDSIDDDAAIVDREHGVYHDTSRIHTTKSDGAHIRIESVLGARRSVQGRPVLFQAGSSADGLELGARYAEGVFFGKETIDEASAFTTRLKNRSRALGRKTPPIAFSSLNYLIGSTEEEVHRIEETLSAEVTPQQSLSFFQKYFGDTALPVDVEDLDAPLPDLPEHTERQQTALAAFRRIAAERPYTIREFLARTRGGYMFYLSGTPGQFAETIIDWYRRGATDGFALVPKFDILSQVQIFADEVVPLLRKAGVFRHEYRGTTFRDHLGLVPPKSIHAEGR